MRHAVTRAGSRRGGGDDGQESCQSKGLGLLRGQAVERKGIVVSRGNVPRTRQLYRMDRL